METVIAVPQPASLNRAWEPRTAEARTRSLRESSTTRRRPPHLAVLSALLACATLCAQAQQSHPTEAQVKAAYLFNFGKFVQWHAGRDAASDSFAICILGRDPFGATLDSTVEGESLDGRKIRVRRLASFEAGTQCDILFIGSSEEDRLPAILAAVRHQGALTVSDMPHFAERGGMIGFVTQQDRIRFEVNRNPAEESHLLLSSELLKVAAKVIDKPGPEH